MPTQSRPEPTARRSGNRLLDRLPEDEYVRLAPSLVSTTMKLKHILNQADNPIHDVYFPTTAVVSTLVLMEDGSEVETILIGAEGMVGLTVALGIDFALHNAICQVPGNDFRLPATSFREALERSPTLDALMRRYAAVVLRQVTQVVACNARHPVNERLCRWLLHVPRPRRPRRIPHDAGVHGGDAGRATPDRHHHRRHSATGRVHHLPSGGHPDCRPLTPGGGRLRVLRRHQVTLRPHSPVAPECPGTRTAGWPVINGIRVRR